MDITGTGLRLPAARPWPPAPAPPTGAGPVPQPVIFPPEIYPIPGARLFTPEGNATVSNAAVTTLVSTTVQSSEIGVIRSLVFVLNNMTLATVASFAILYDGVPTDYGPVTYTPRLASVLLDSRDVVIRIPPNVTTVSIAVTIGATDPNSYLVGATLGGWCWSPGQEVAYREGRVR